MFFCILLTSVVAFATAAPADKANGLNNGTNESIRDNSAKFSSSCGGILKASAGAISYKHFDTPEPNQVCVWIVRAPGATNYAGNVNKPDVSSTLIITGIGYTSGINHFIPDSSEPFSVNGSVLVITFTNSNNTNSRGFYLNFLGGVVEGHRPAASTSEDHLVSGNSWHIKYPSGRDEYGNEEVSLFVFEPVRNSVGLMQKTQVLYIKEGIEPECADHLNVMKFDRNSPGLNKWIHSGGICSLVESETVTNHDLIFMYFRSDNSTTHSGFHLYAQTL